MAKKPMKTSEKKTDSGPVLKRVTHRFPMPLFGTAADDQDLQEFDAGVRQSLKQEQPLQYAVEPSIEGITVEMVYEKGTLTVASTRGDGEVGEEITGNIKTILTVPLRLERLREAPPLPELLVVWGRVYVEKAALEARNRSRIESRLASYATPAEAAADSLRQPNPRVTAKRPLNVFCNGAAGVFPDTPYETHYEQMLAIQQWGLRVNRPHLRTCIDVEEVLEYCHDLQGSRGRLPYPVDGVLIGLNRLSLQRQLGEESGTAQWARAYKFP